MSEITSATSSAPPALSKTTPARPPVEPSPQKGNPGPKGSTAAQADKSPNLTAALKEALEKEKTVAQFCEIMSRPRKKGAPPLREDLMAAAAEVGDVEGVLEHWLQSEGDRDLNFVMAYAREAMKNLANRDPKSLVQYAFTRMLVQQVSMMMRVERRISTAISAYDKYNPDSSLPADVKSEWLPRLERIQQTIQATSKNMASTLHEFSLAQGGTKLDRQRGSKVIPMRPRSDDESSGEDVALGHA